MRVSLIGTGLMGEPMARRLLEAGYDLTVHNRTIAKTRSLVEAGVRRADSAAEAVAASEVTVLILADSAAIRAALAPAGSLPDLSGRTLIQMATIGAAESLELARDVEAHGGDYLEAPVLGSRAQAADGSLFVLVGSTAEQFERWRDLLSVLGSNPRRMGEVGQAATVKLALNQLIASHITSFSLSLGMVRRAGVDVDKFMGILRRSALYASSQDTKLPRMQARDFSDPNFQTRLLLKDIDLVRQEADRLGLTPTAIEGIRDVVQMAIEQGLADADYSSVYNAVDPEDS
jgi:3-hydroxyisobutyrate dehydrogenase